MTPEDDPKPRPERVIRLQQYLQMCQVVDSGGQAKHLIQSGEVKVNGAVETRRSKQLSVGDVVELLGTRLVVD